MLGFKISPIFRLRRSTVPGHAPSTADLEFTDVGVNSSDGRMFIKRFLSDGTEEITEIGGSTAATGVTSLSGGDTGLTPASPTTGALVLGGVLSVNHGGTGATNSTGSGDAVLNTSPTLVTPALGTPSTGNLSNCTNYPFSALGGRPSTLSGYGITDAASSTHIHGNITSGGAIGATAGLPIITGANGLLQAGAFGTTAGTFCAGDDPRLTGGGGGTTTFPLTFNNTGTGDASPITFDGSAARTISWNTIGACSTTDARLSDTRPSPGYLFFSTTGNGGPYWSEYNGATALTISWNTIGACSTTDARLSDKRSTPNLLTFNNSGSGAASGSTFDGSAALTISANTIGALPLTGGTLSGALTATSFSGSGSGLTALNATQLTAGTVPDGRLNGTYTGASITGNAATATKLATPRAITLAGDVTGSASFDGSAAVTLTATVADDSHSHATSTLSDVSVGAYTPTVSTSVNITTATPQYTTYMRVGNMVFVSGRLQLQPTATGAFSITLNPPIVRSANFTTVAQANGTAVESQTPLLARISAVVSSTNIIVEGHTTATYTGNRIMSYTYSYYLT